MFSGRLVPSKFCGSVGWKGAKECFSGKIVCSFSFCGFSLFIFLRKLVSPFVTLRGYICASFFQISEIKFADIPDVDLSRLGEIKYGNFSVEVVDPVSDYLELMEVMKTLAHTKEMQRKKIYKNFEN